MHKQLMEKEATDLKDWEGADERVWREETQRKNVNYSTISKLNNSNKKNKITLLTTL